MRAHNTALHRTAIPLRSIVAGELGLWLQIGGEQHTPAGVLTGLGTS